MSRSRCRYPDFSLTKPETDTRLRLLPWFVSEDTIWFINGPKMTNSQNTHRSPDDLKPCSSSPNCVSSVSTSRKQHVPPIPYECEMPEAIDNALGIIESMERSMIKTREDNYIHAEFTSGLFRFVDDLEMVFDDEKKIIHIRSASRTGYYDFGVNGKRVWEIRKRFLNK